MSSREYWKGKRIAVVGLGPHGEMVEDVSFLIKAGALVSVYDLRSEARLKTHLVFLRSLGLANYVCGSIPADDLEDQDLIVLSHEYPRDSSFLAKVLEKNLPVEYPESLFFRHAPPVTIVGIMGRVGKSTVASMLVPMLEAISAKNEQNLFVIDPESPDGIIAHLHDVRSGDLVLAVLSPVAMKELHKLRTSPHIAVFTDIPRAPAFEKTPFEILEFQTYNNFIVASDGVIDATYAHGFHTRAKMLRTRSSLVPADWQVGGRGTHDRDHAALALQVARLLKASDDQAREVLSSWKPLKGRLEFIKKVRNIEFYNDSASVAPFSTELALRTLATDKNLVLVFGGVDTGHEYRDLYSLLPRTVHTIVLLPGSGSMKERSALTKLEGVELYAAPSVEESASVALEHAKKGDRVVFSPGFEAGGVDRSRRERGEKFVKAVRGL